MSQTIRILIADDHPVIREGLSAMLSRVPGFEVAGEARDGKEAMDMALRLKPDIVLMDLRMPGMDGVEAMRMIHLQCETIRFIILTVYDNDEYIFEGIRAGASAYLLKDVSRETLIQAIREVYSGQSLLHPQITRKLLDHVSGGAGKEQNSLLTERELEILQMMASGASNKEIARGLSISSHTVKTHVSNIYQKLEVSDRAEAVAKALREGILRG
ncbi:two component transcriptional regulator, LuxR family [Anaerolinea thermolimosa]|uniref:response regulator n=1 Tax=Anaerolinea thermolimosa TaxID=229919 RepID=UPI001EEF698A|nr:response regulator transcription factor [Anaerolinea thermolimosa]GAP06690.1 two component transcriptional regulator, LuxR family [Anaerolinea thermolimosa]